MIFPKVLLIVSVFAFLTSLPTLSAENQTNAFEDVVIGKKYKLRSKVLGEDRSYSVYLPPSYPENRRFQPRQFPVAYLLDGDTFFHSASGILQQFSLTGELPELILVAVGNTDRTRDLTPTHSTKTPEGKDTPFLKSSGGGDKFQQFLREELIPHIDREYRTMPYRILAGHSFGGLTAIDALLKTQQVFHAAIAIDPSVDWDTNVMFKRAAAFFKSGGSLRGRVYICGANTPIPGHPPSNVEEFAAAFKNKHSDLFESKYQYFANEDHGTIPLLGLYHGFRFIFDGYRIPVEMMLQPDASALRDHFAKVSKKLGIRLMPAEKTINDWGYELLQVPDLRDEALQYFLLNVDLYPTSFNAYDSLAEAYDKTGDKQKARQFYEKSLELNPKNENACKWLTRNKE